MKKYFKRGFIGLVLLIVVGTAISFYLGAQSTMSRAERIIQSYYLKPGSPYLKKGVTPKDLETAILEAKSIQGNKLIKDEDKKRLMFIAEESLDKYNVSKGLSTLYDIDVMYIDGTDIVERPKLRRTVTQRDIDSVREYVDRLDTTDAMSQELIQAFRYAEDAVAKADSSVDKLRPLLNEKNDQAMDIVREVESEVDLYKDEYILRDTMRLIDAVKIYQSKKS